MIKYFKNKYVYSLFFAVFIVLISASGLFFSVNNQLNDLFYQKTSMTNPDICIIGIDAETIDQLGSFPFNREIFAEILNILNNNETPPIAIGIDILFTGTTNNDSDQALFDAINRWDNIILACSANYGTELVFTSDDHFYLSTSHIQSMNYPFPALLEVANLGHINSSLDQDGILRHGILAIENEQGETIPSFHLALYEKYSEFYGLDMGVLPENQWYLPFTAKSGGHYDGYSLSKVLSGEIPSSVFKDKIVLIGPYTIGLQDHFYTAIDHTNMMFGVEYQANALEVLIKQEYITAISVLCNHLLLFLTLFFLFNCTHSKKLLFSGILCLVSTITFLIFCKVSFESGYLFDVFYLPFGIILLYITNIFVNAVTSSIEKAKVTATFKRYVAPVVVEQILKEGVDNLKLGGSLTEVSVMFIDVRNFTPMSEKFSPDIVVDILNRFMDCMAETIMNNGGTLDKFIGDAIMCFWGAPLPQEDYVMKSVETALQIIENIAPIAKEVEEIYDHQVYVGIGIQCGKAVVGNIGSQNRMDFTVIGDTVNTAARLESNAKGGNVINISEDVFKEVKDVFHCKEIPNGLTLKGKEGIFRAYTVESRKNGN